MRFAHAMPFLFTLIALSSCDHGVVGPPDQTVLEGTWKTIGIWDGGSSSGGLVTTLRVHQHRRCVTIDQYLGGPVNWTYQQTYPEECSGFTIDHSFIVDTDTALYKPSPVHFSIDNSVLSLSPGWILVGSSDTLEQSTWNATYLDHYEDTVPFVYHLDLSVTPNGTGRMVMRSGGPTSYTDTLQVQRIVDDKTIAISGSSRVDTVKFAIFANRLYLVFTSNPHRLAKM